MAPVYRAVGVAVCEEMGNGDIDRAPRGWHGCEGWLRGRREGARLAIMKVTPCEKHILAPVSYNFGIYELKDL